MKIIKNSAPDLRVVSLLYVLIKITAMKQSAISFLVVRNEGNKNVTVTFANSEKLDIIKNKSVRKYLMNIVSQRRAILRIDLTDVRIIDNEGFDILNLLYQISRKNDSRVVLNGVGTELLELIDLVRKYSVFYIKEVNINEQYYPETNTCWLN